MQFSFGGVVCSFDGLLELWEGRVGLLGRLPKVLRLSYPFAQQVVGGTVPFVTKYLLLLREGKSKRINMPGFSTVTLPLRDEL